MYLNELKDDDYQKIEKFESINDECILNQYNYVSYFDYIYLGRLLEKLVY